MDATKIVLVIVMGLVAVGLYYFLRWLFSRFISRDWIVRLLTFVLTLGICCTAVILIDNYLLQ